jgi:Heparinase II/III-like protein/Heparinase II/III N-terminus
MKQVRLAFILCLALTFISGCGGHSGSGGDEQNPNMPDVHVQVTPELGPSEIEHLWKPQSTLGVQKNLNLYQDNRKVEIVHFDPWSVPENPTWRENPYEDISWEFYYQALTWLYIPAYGFETTGDPAYLSQIKNYIFSWIASNKTPDTSMAWYDHAVAYRSSTLIYLYYNFFKDSLTDQELITFTDSIIQHGLELEKLIKDPRFKANNHNMFHSLALFNLSISFPSLPMSSEWKELSRTRIAELLTEMVEVSEGASLEQATSYQWTALSLFNVANELLNYFNSGLDGASMDVMNKMVDFGAIMRWPDGSLPAVGDTSYGYDPNSAGYLNKYYQNGYGTNITKFFVDGSVYEPNDTYFFPKTGYFLFRPSYMNDFCMFVDMGPSIFIHGHNDAMNVLLYDNGSPMIIDSGGPYRYNNELTSYFKHARAHNTVVVNNLDYLAGDVTVTSYFDSSNYSFVEGIHQKYSGVTHRRVVFNIKPNSVVILDSLISNDQNNDYTLTYHFPPDSTVDINDESSLTVYSDSNSSMSISVKSKAPAFLEIIEGQDQPYVQGWVTTEPGKRIPAPVAQFHQTGQNVWFATVINTSPTPGENVTSVNVLEADDDWRLSVDEQGRSFDIYLPKIGEPEISVNPN